GVLGRAREATTQNQSARSTVARETPQLGAPGLENVQ
ncbi:MAG: hypothetical protein QOI78_9380, partial [Actinomycetota bacterium]|nr:hypothetical protein [Actinomycetota bacterium]